MTRRRPATVSFAVALPGAMPALVAARGAALLAALLLGLLLLPAVTRAQDPMTHQGAGHMAASAEMGTMDHAQHAARGEDCPMMTAGTTAPADALDPAEDTTHPADCPMMAADTSCDSDGTDCPMMASGDADSRAKGCPMMAGGDADSRAKGCPMMAGGDSALGSQGAAMAASHGQMHDMSMKGASGIPRQVGQAAFAALAEMVTLLESDPATDWSHVDLDTLREHLVDMDRVVTDAEVHRQDVPGGFSARVTGQGRTLEAIRRMVPAHSRHMNGRDGLEVQVQDLPDGVEVTVTTSDPDQTAHLRALGFFGFLARGDHHRPHHLAMAKGLGHP